jgi:hypothetical protein
MCMGVDQARHDDPRPERLIDRVVRWREGAQVRVPRPSRSHDDAVFDGDPPVTNWRAGDGQDPRRAVYSNHTEAEPEQTEGDRQARRLETICNCNPQQSAMLSLTQPHFLERAPRRISIDLERSARIAIGASHRELEHARHRPLAEDRIS